MESNFKKALPKFLAHEGGFVNHPSDPGGATNMGVTIANYRRYVKRGGTVADLKNITREEVGKVFKKHYWDKVRGDDLPSGVDYCVADFAINSGPSRAAKYLQWAVGVTQDGVIGPKTLAAVNKADPRKVIDFVCDQRLAFMKRIKGGKLWDVFGTGWSRRVADVRLVSRMWIEETGAPQDAFPTRPAPVPPQKPVERPQPVPAPEPAPEPPSAPRGKSGRNTVIGGIIAVALAALAGWLGWG